MISILIPVRNGGEDFRRCLDSIARQRIERPYEVVVVDSGSTDDTVAIAEEHGARVESIPASQFNHGGTRNLLGELASGELLVFTVHDAYAEREDWLERLTAPLEQDESLAGVYGRQLPHFDATPPERFFLAFLYGPFARMQRVADRSELSVETTLFSNVNSAIRRSAWERHRFPEDIVLSEDQDWAVRVLLDGGVLRYEPEAAVRHSHPYTVPWAFRRFFDSGASAERAYLAGARPSAAVLRRTAARYAREELAWMVREGHTGWIPYTVLYEAAKFAGLQLGTRHRLLPRALKRRWSTQPDYWTRERSRGAGGLGAA